MLYRGDETHAAFDNLAFADNRTLVAVEDAGDTLHSAAQRARLDVGVHARANYGDPGAPRRCVLRRGPRRVGHARLRPSLA